MDQKKNSVSTWIIILIVVIILGGLLAYTLENRKSDDQSVAGTTTTTTTNTNYTFKDGTYSATGSYQAPSGTESIQVSLTVQGNVVTNVVVTPNAVNPMSARWQAKFVSGVSQAVVGKNLNEVNLTQVSGSSLTPKGFNSAVDQIKAQAKV